MDWRVKAVLYWIAGAIFTLLLFMTLEGFHPLALVDPRTFDTDPACNAARLRAITVSDNVQESRRGDACQVVPVRVEHLEIQYRSYWRSTPWITYPTFWVRVVTPTGSEHDFQLEGVGDAAAYNRLSVGQTVNALMYGMSVAWLATSKTPVSTSENPDEVVRTSQAYALVLAVTAVVAVFGAYVRRNSG